MDTAALGTLSNFNIKMNTVLAMNDLLKTRPFDKLTIMDICSKAGISRATFYRYFDDKFSIVQWHASYAYTRGVDEIGRTLTWYEGYYRTEVVIAELGGFYHAVSKSNDYNAVDNFAPRARAQTMKTTVTDYFHRELTDLLKFQIEATAAAEVHMLPKWHYGQINVSLDRVCKMMCTCVPRDLFELLDTPLDPDITAEIIH